MDIRKLVGTNLRRLRLEHGLSQEALANEAEIDRAYMGGLERGIRNPTVLVLDRLARVLNVSVGEIVTVPSKGTPAPPELPRGRHAQPKHRQARAR